MSCLSDRGLCRSANAIRLPFGDQLGPVGRPFPDRDPVQARSVRPHHPEAFARRARDECDPLAIRRPRRGEIRVVVLRLEDPALAGAIWADNEEGLAVAAACERDQSVAVRALQDASIVAAALAACRRWKLRGRARQGPPQTLLDISWFSPLAQMVSVEEQWGIGAGTQCVTGVCPETICLHLEHTYRGDKVSGLGCSPSSARDRRGFQP